MLLFSFVITQQWSVPLYSCKRTEDLTCTLMFFSTKPCLHQQAHISQYWCFNCISLTVTQNVASVIVRCFNINQLRFCKPTKPVLALLLRVRSRSSWMTCSRPSSARRTEEVPCLSPSSTCLTSWMSRQTNTPYQTLMYGTLGRATGEFVCTRSEWA